MIFWIFRFSSKHTSYENHVSQKTGVKNTFLFFYPSAKGRNELKIGEIVVTFQDASAYFAQKIVAPPKRAIFDFMLTFCSEDLCKKHFGFENQMSGTV